MLLKYCRPFRTEAPGAAVEYGSCEPSRDEKKLFTDKCGEDFENENGAGVTCFVNHDKKVDVTEIVTST